MPQAPAAPAANRSLDAVPERCTLRLPPGAAFRHGLALGMTVTIRDAAGRPVPSPGIPINFNLTGMARPGPRPASPGAHCRPLRGDGGSDAAPSHGPLAGLRLKHV